MKRRSFDIVASAVGLGLAALLIIAGGLLTWAHNFVGDEVHTQLAAQKIYFPPTGSPAIAGPEFAKMPVRRSATDERAQGPNEKLTIAASSRSPGQRAAATKARTVRYTEASGIAGAADCHDVQG